MGGMCHGALVPAWMCGSQRWLAQDAASDIPWSSIGNVVKEAHMIVVFSDKVHGYILTDKMLGGQKQEFYEYVLSKANLKK